MAQERPWRCKWIKVARFSRSEGRSAAVKRRLEIKSACHGDKGGLFPLCASLILLFFF